MSVSMIAAVAAAGMFAGVLFLVLFVAEAVEQLLVRSRATH